MTDTKKEEIVEETTEIETETEAKLENESPEEKAKTSNIPDAARFKRPPAFERGNSFSKGGRTNNNFQPAIRKSAQRGR